MERLLNLKKRYEEEENNYRNFLEQLVQLENDKFEFMLNTDFHLERSVQYIKKTYDRPIVDIKTDMETCKYNLLEIREELTNLY